MNNIGETIRTIRKGKGIKQKELAALCDLSANSITSIEKGIHRPTPKNIERICNALNVSVAFLMLSSITEEDFKDEHKILFDTMLVPLRNLLRN